MPPIKTGYCYCGNCGALLQVSKLQPLMFIKHVKCWFCYEENDVPPEPKSKYKVKIEYQYSMLTPK